MFDAFCYFMLLNYVVSTKYNYVYFNLLTKNRRILICNNYCVIFSKDEFFIEMRIETIYDNVKTPIFLGIFASRHCTITRIVTFSITIVKRQYHTCTGFASNDVVCWCTLEIRNSKQSKELR